MTVSQKAARALARARQKTEQQQAHDRGDDGRKKTHAEHGVAPQRSSQKLGDGNQQRLAVIGKREVLGPDPLVGFIAAEPDLAAGVVGKVGQQFEEDERVTEAQPEPVPRWYPQRRRREVACPAVQRRDGASRDRPGGTNCVQCLEPLHLVHNQGADRETLELLPPGEETEFDQKGNFEDFRADLLQQRGGGGGGAAGGQQIVNQTAPGCPASPRPCGWRWCSCRIPGRNPVRAS